MRGVVSRTDANWYLRSASREVSNTHGARTAAQGTHSGIRDAVDSVWQKGGGVKVAGTTQPNPLQTKKSRSLFLGLRGERARALLPGLGTNATLYSQSFSTHRRRILRWLGNSSACCNTSRSLRRPIWPGRFGTRDCSSGARRCLLARSRTATLLAPRPWDVRTHASQGTIVKVAGTRQAVRGRRPREGYSQARPLLSAGLPGTSDVDGGIRSGECPHRMI